MHITARTQEQRQHLHQELEQAREDRAADRDLTYPPVCNDLVHCSTCKCVTILGIFGVFFGVYVL